ncbi:MAG TPA: CBS domain-containing protein [Desulfomonilaceae bacterium]|nr:CBS domain-containing protein [Desulfomonilaceae bacterium]
MPIAMKVRDLLVPLSEYAVTTVDKPLKEAIPALRKLYCQVEDGKCTEAGHRTILVLDNAGRLVGILDFKSILKVLIPEIAGGLTARLEALGVSIAFAQADTPDLDEARISFRARVLKNAETRVADVMLKIKGTISADADLLEALKSLYNNKITVLPVYDGHELVGVLRDSDLFLVVSDILRE